MIIKIKRVNEKPYCFSVSLGESSIGLNNVQIEFKADDTHGELTMTKFNGEIKFRFSKWEIQDDHLLFYTGIEDEPRG